MARGPEQHPGTAAGAGIGASSLDLSRTPVPWRKVWGTAITTAACLLVGLWGGHVQWGAWAFLGGFTSFYVSGQPYRSRAGILFVVMLGLAAAMAVGSLSATWWVMAVAFGLLALASTFLAGAGRLPLPGAFLFILVACVGAAAPAAGQAAERVAFTLVGGAIGWLVGMAGWALHPTRPEAERVEAAYAALGAFVAAIATDDAVASEHRAATAIRATASARRLDGAAAARRTAALAARAESIFWAAVALSGERAEPLPVPWRSCLQRLGREHVWPDSDQAAPPPTVGPGSLERRFVHAVSESVRAIAGPQPAPRVDAGADDRPGLHPSGRAMPPFLPHAALRTAITAAAAVVLAHLVGLKHPYWLPLTAAAVLQGHTVEMLTRRAVQRVLGTVGGLALAAGLVAGLHPTPLAAFAMVLALQAAMRILMAKNYGLTVMPMTAFALLIIYASSPTGVSSLVLARLGDTVVGVVLALAATYLLWPRASSGRLPGALAAAIREEAQLFRALAADDRATAGAAARRVETDLDRLVRTAEDALSEVPASPRARRLWPAAASATRLGYLLLAAGEGALELAADEATTAQVDAVFGDLATAAARGGHGPRHGPDGGRRDPRPLPDLGGTGRELRTLAMNLGP